VYYTLFFCGKTALFEPFFIKKATKKALKWAFFVAFRGIFVPKT